MLGLKPLPEDSVYYPSFDYLRIVAATTVAATHAELLAFPHAGNFPVQVFFALSGWLIGGILLSTEAKDLPKFYFNRSARIWIPYFLAVFILLLTSILREPVSPKWIEFVIYKLTFVYNLFGPPQLALKAAMPLSGTGNHFWSICAEEQFYLLSPLLLVLVPTGRSIPFWAALSVLSLISPVSGDFTAISLGVLGAVIRKRWGDWQEERSATLALAVVSCLLLVSVFFDLLPYRFTGPVGGLSLVLLAAHSGRPSAVGQFVGGVSYPMYLNHWIGVFAAHAIFGKFGLRDSLSSKIASVVLGFCIAAVLYMVVDRTIKAHRNSYFTAKRGRLAATTGYLLVCSGLAYGVWVH